MLQTLVVYLQASLAKLAGETWLNGSAVYYAARWEEVRLSAELDWASAHPAFGPLLTYGVVLIELFYLPLILTRARPAAILLISAMHAAIAYTMGLVGFSLIMLGANAVVLSDVDYRSIAKRLYGVRLPASFRLNSGLKSLRPADAP